MNSIYKINIIYPEINNSYINEKYIFIFLSMNKQDKINMFVG